MIKYVILAAIVLLSTLIGFEYGEAIKVRRDNLSKLLDSIVNLESEIFYCLTPLYEATMKIAKISSKPINILFEEVSNELTKNNTESVSEAFEVAIKKSEGELCLLQEDYNILLELSKSIGTTDLEGQKKIFEITINKIKNNLKHASEEADKNIKMYRVLGVSVGLIIAVFLI